MHKDDLMKFLESFAQGARENAVPDTLVRSATEYVQELIKKQQVLTRQDAALAWAAFDHGFQIGRNH